MEQFHFSKESVLSTWFLGMYIMPLWCRWEAKLVWAREVKAKNCLSKPRIVTEDLRMWLDVFTGSSNSKGQSLLVYGWYSPLRWLIAGSVSACILQWGVCTQGWRKSDDFFFQQELAVKMQFYVTLKLTLIYSCVMFCIGTQWSFAPYLKSCGKPNRI